MERPDLKGHHGGTQWGGLFAAIIYSGSHPLFTIKYVGPKGKDKR